MRLFIALATSAGVYLVSNQYIAPHIPSVHSFAFGFDGLGFSYLALGSAVVGVFAFRATK